MKKEKIVHLEDGDYLIVSETITIFGEKTKYKRFIKLFDDKPTLSKCNKNVEANIKENHRALRLSMQEASKDIFCD